MYKRLLLVASLVLATAVLLAQKGSALVKNNASKYRIVIPVKATETEKRAASIFKEYVSKMTGVQINIITDNNKAVPNEVRIGATNRLSSKQLHRVLYFFLLIPTGNYIFLWNLCQWDQMRTEFYEQKGPGWKE